MTTRKCVENGAEFPTWAPPGVIHYLGEYELQLEHYAAEDPRRGCPALLRTLLVEQRMKRVWEALLESKKPMASLIFAAAACHGFLGPRCEEGLTPAQHKAFIEKVRKLSTKLSNTLRGGHLDEAVMSHLALPYNARALSARVDGCTERPGQPRWNRFSEILDSVASAAPYLCPKNADKRTHGEKACRRQFVKHLTAFFDEYLGGSTRPLVVDATGTAFDDPNFSDRQVRRNAPRSSDRKTKKRPLSDRTLPQ